MAASRQTLKQVMQYVMSGPSDTSLYYVVQLVTVNMSHETKLLVLVLRASINVAAAC